MSIELRVPTVLRKHTDGRAKLTGSGATVGDFLVDVGATYPALREAVVDDDGSLRRYVNVYVNDEDVRYLDGAKTELADGDEVAILPAVAGGA